MTIASMAQNFLVTSCSIDPKRKERKKERKNPTKIEKSLRRF